MISQLIIKQSKQSSQLKAEPSKMLKQELQSTITLNQPFYRISTNYNFKPVLNQFLNILKQDFIRLRAHSFPGWPQKNDEKIYLDYKGFNRFNNNSNKMLRKNLIQKPLKLNNPVSVQTQTDEFLLFLPLEQKLKGLMSQYHNLQNLHQQTMNKNQYLQYKNQLLESSLMQLTYVFNNNLLGQNIRHLKEIADLQQLIESQTNELLILKNQANFKLAQQNQKKAHHNILQEEKIPQYCSKQVKKASFSKIQEPSKTTLGNAFSKISMTDETSRRLFEQDSTQNQFLVMEKPQFSKTNDHLGLILQQKKLKQLNSSVNKPIPQTTRTNRSQSKHHSSRKKKSFLNEKQNQCVQKMIKIQAELKLKRFMSDFQKGSKLQSATSKQLSIDQNAVYYLMQETNGSQMLEKQASFFTSYSLKNSVR